MISDKLKIEMLLRDAQYDSLVQLEDILLKQNVVIKKSYTEDELSSIYRMIFRKSGNFDYAFPSFSFALATGVGKTRLLGACIYTLYKLNGYKNFFVIAPNKTIYDKFIREFNERDEKYIFQGITNLPEFRVFTGEDFNKANTKQSTQRSEDFTVYIFNIDKFKSEERVLQVKKINEYLGNSFYEYVSNLKDLVVLMDESHKYKTNISINAINGLKPVLGLEFTATPFKKITENEKSGKFENILYEHTLGAALAAEHPVLKRPQLLFRKDFDYDALSKKGRYDILIADALDNHERIKTMLEAYFQNENIDMKKRFLPLVLIVCEDIRHAIQTEHYLKKDFLKGRYKDRIVRVHSTPKDNKALPPEAKYDEDTEVEKLLELEKPGNPYEIVINVNKLGLGWDVKNVYTVVPLRAFDSQVFVEQTIGRGLRLPFGKWIEDEELNALRVAYHNNFGKVIQKADAWLENIEVVEPDKKQFEKQVLKAENTSKAIPTPKVEPEIAIDFKLAYFEPAISSRLDDVDVSIVVKDLATKEERELGKVEEKLEKSPREYILEMLLKLPELSTKELPVLEKIVKRYLALLGKKRAEMNYPAASHGVSKTRQRHYTGSKQASGYGPRGAINLENRIRIINDIYEQVKVKIGEKTNITYKTSDERVDYTDYEATFEAGFIKEHYEAWDDTETKRGIATGYTKTIYKENVFDSRQERMVAKILEKDNEVIKWFRPYKKDNFSVVYQFKGERHDYIPDFIAETEYAFYIIEPKSKKEIDEGVTKAKARAALEWINEANKTSKKKWEYLLIRHDRIISAVSTFKNLRNQAENLKGF